LIAPEGGDDSGSVATAERTQQEGASVGDRVVVGLLAAPGLAHDLAKQLASELPERLAERFPETEWEFAVEVEERAGPSRRGGDLVKLTRERMLSEGWDLAICLTDLPLLVRRRPVTAHASVSLGVGLVSVPAFGAVEVETRVRETVLRLIGGLVHGDGDRERRLEHLTAPIGRALVQEGGTVRFVTATVRGNLRLVLGMVRANRPWRLAAGLSRALVSALGTTAIAIASTGVWHLADGMGWLRLLGLSLTSVLATCLSLIVVHDLWERMPQEHARERVVLINLATALTVAIGVLTLYLALFAITFVVGLALIPHGVIAQELGHPVGLENYLRLAWLMSSMATIGGALGAAVESNEAVREAAYGYRPDEDAEASRAAD
jgi:hypothetical protein